jgi:hypothetical protein
VRLAGARHRERRLGNDVHVGHHDLEHDRQRDLHDHHHDDGYHRDRRRRWRDDEHIHWNGRQHGHG